jgi:hypothetical protein
MIRRIIAVVAILALAFIYLPGVVADLSASAQPVCCDGTMCPMHRMAGNHVECSTGAGHSSGALQSCPDVAPRYTASLTFVGVAPSVFFAMGVISIAPILAFHEPVNAYRGIVLPPPRTSLA